MLTREDLVKLAREAASGVHRPDYCRNPASFDPHEWVLEAMQRAYERGLAAAQAPGGPNCAACGRAECVGGSRCPSFDHHAENARIEAASGWSEP